jgi:hypothetical protein
MYSPGENGVLGDEVPEVPTCSPGVLCPVQPQLREGEKLLGDEVPIWFPPEFSGKRGG